MNSVIRLLTSEKKHLYTITSIYKPEQDLIQNAEMGTDNTRTIDRHILIDNRDTLDIWVYTDAFY